jgi:serine protease AprX
MLVAREGETGVDDHDLAADLVDHHVLAHFAEASERDDSQCLVGHRAAKYCLPAGTRDGVALITLSSVVTGHCVDENEYMPLFATRARLRLALLLIPGALIAVPATAHGATRPRPSNVDPALAAVAASAQKRQPRMPLQVIVYGRGSGKAVRTARGRARRALPLLAAHSARVDANRLGKLAKQRGVAYVAPDYPVLPTSKEPQPPILFPALESLFPAVDAAPSAWNLGYAGRGVGIAVIDSGVAASEDFGDRLRRVELPGTSPDDEYGHGTFVAGVAAGQSPDGRYVGIAPHASVFSIDVSRSDGVYTSDVIAGIGWVLANHRKLKIRVVVLALTETTPSSYRSNPLDTAVEELWRRGVVVVASAGNLGRNSTSFAPANDPRVITVGAIDTNSTLDAADDREATFSSYGATLDGVQKPELLAPGRRIASVLPPASVLGRAAPLANWVAPGYAVMSGTSFSAPQVAGAAAVLLEQHPTWRPDQVKWTLMQTLRPVAGASAGALDIGAAVGFEGTPGSANRGLRPAQYGLRGATRPMFVRMRPHPRSRPRVDWNASSWNASSWNASSWNASSWNRASWVASSWNASSWNASSWNASSWNAAAFE